MTTAPTARQLATLRAIAAQGGSEQIDDAEVAEQCAAQAWLLAEGATGYAVTMEGIIALRAATDC